MSKALFMKNLKAHWKLVLVFALVLLMYLLIIMGMYDPVNPDLMSKMAEFKLPPEMLKAFGFDVQSTELIGFTAGYLYGMLLLAMPMVCYVMLGNKLVAAMVEKGSMAAVLAAPVKRTKVAFTQGAFLLLSVTTLILVVTLAGLAFAEAAHPGLLDQGRFIQMNLGLLALHFAISGICFFSSCLFSDTRWSLALGAGLPVFFLLVSMLSNTGDKLRALRFFTPFSLYNAMDYVRGGQVMPQALILIAAALLLYGAGVYVFDKKDLPL
jgi:ABC-2 type transport system permease protein